MTETSDQDPATEAEAEAAEAKMDLTSLTSLRQNESSSKRGQGFASTLLKPRTTNLLSAIIAAIVLGVCGVLLFYGYKSLRDGQNAAIKREADKGRIETLQRSYDTDVRLWDKKNQDYHACLDFAVTRVEGRSALRDTLFHLIDGFVVSLKTVLPDNPLADQFADIFTQDQHEYIDENYSPLNLESLQATCTVPGPEPLKPPELQ